MKIDNLEVKNYKCFYENQSMDFADGFNLLIGKNNSGKTTILELLAFPENINDPHRSEKNLVGYKEAPDRKALYSISIGTTISELTRIYGESLFLPLLADANFTNTSAAVENALRKDSKIVLKHTITESDSTLTVKTNLGWSTPATTKKSTYGINLDFRKHINGYNDKEPHAFSKSTSQLTNFSQLKPSIYKFSPLRIPKPQCNMQNSFILLPDASNIALCINHMQTNDAEGHMQLCSLIERIFPEVKWIQAPPNTNSQFELQCLPLHPAKRRDDLAIPIHKMGTGIGQIISILYVMLTSRFSQIVAIDEPSSFLHPKALRELLQILESHGKQHQYILTGHSPDVLTAIEPSKIIYFELENSSSKTKQFTKHQYHEFRSELSDLGIRMTDLHAKDRVIWVEGQTEEIVFPMLLRKFCPEIFAETAVLRVTHTGTFESKRIPISEVAQTYERLTKTSLAPPMMAIILDRELRKHQEIEKIEDENNQSLRFLPSRMIENYVLHAPAIQAVLKTYEVEADIADIKKLLPNEEENYSSADGAKILKEIFDTLSDAKLAFRKTTHTPEIFEWIIENNDAWLNELKEFVMDVCKQGSQR